MKKKFFVLVCLVCLVMCVVGEEITNIYLFPTKTSVLQADELLLATFGSDMALELHFTDVKLEKSANKENYANLVMDFSIVNYDFIEYNLLESVCAYLSYNDAFVYEAVCTFKQPTIDMLIETSGNLSLELPASVVASGGERLILTMSLAGVVSDIYVDVSEQAAKLGFVTAAADKEEGLSFRKLSQHIYSEWQGQQKNGLRYLVVNLELFNNSHTTYMVTDVLSAEVNYRFLYDFPAQIYVAYPSLGPLEIQTVTLVFELPYIVIKDDDNTFNLTVFIEGQPQQLDMRKSEVIPPLHAYRVFKERKTWTDAEAACEAMGGHLVTITTKEENALVSSLFKEGDLLWYGGYKDEQYVFHWVTDESFRYTHWRKGEPSTKSEKYLGSFTNKEWADFYGAAPEMVGYICEWEDNALCPYDDCVLMDINNANLTTDPIFQFEEITIQEGFLCKTNMIRAYQSHTESSNANYRKLIIDLAVINCGTEVTTLEGMFQSTLSFRTRYNFDSVIKYSSATLSPLEIGSVQLTFDLPVLVLNGKDEEVNLSLLINGKSVASDFKISQWVEAPHAYSLISKKCKWNVAKKNCETMGGYLVTITSAEENRFVQSLYKESDYPWFGGYADEARNWHWVTGEDFVFSNWDSGQPDNWMSKEDCIDSYSGKRWNDNNHDHDTVYICEWDDVSLVPENIVYSVFQR